MFFLAERGFRCIAHDRRGHGRSSQPFNGNDMNTYADDLAKLTRVLNLKNAVHVGHSTGGGEVARYIGRHGTERVAKAVLVSSVTPYMIQDANNPKGVPRSVLDGLREAVLADRSQFFQDLTTPFFNGQASKGVADAFWHQGITTGFPASFFCIKAFSETDMTEDLRKMDVPTLVIHGDADQIVPIAATSQRAIQFLPQGQLKIYPGAPHGLPIINKNQLNQDLLAFISS